MYGYIIYVGCLMSVLMLYVVSNHASRHVCRLAVLPGLVDEIIITTHNLLGTVSQCEKCIDG